MKRALADIRRAYWEEKHLSSALRIAAPILDDLSAYGEAELAVVKAIAYDIGSFTWPGWDEAGIEIDADHRRVGLDAARINHELAESLDKAPGPKAMAEWLVGAHLLANADVDGARERFTRSEAIAYSGGEVDLELLARGYVVICDVLSGVAEDDALVSVEALVSARPGGQDTIDQFRTALAVFTRGAGAEV